jgi:hypothetical protein
VRVCVVKGWVLNDGQRRFDPKLFLRVIFS